MPINPFCVLVNDFESKMLQMMASHHGFYWHGRLAIGWVPNTGDDAQHWLLFREDGIFWMPASTKLSDDSRPVSLAHAVEIFATGNDPTV